MTRVRLHIVDASQARTGATLTEILMAILIMAVGIVSVFTLFPISVLRTIQATQQTNSKILKINAAEIVATSPSVLTQFGAGPVFSGQQWRPDTSYATGDIVVPTAKASSGYPTPLVFYQATVTGPARSLLREPNWDPRASVTETTNDGTMSPPNIRWDPIVNTNGNPRNYIVDPLGWNIATTDALAPADSFGNKTDRTSGLGANYGVAASRLTRINGGISSSTSAQSNVGLLDSWEEIVSATPVSTTNGSPATITFPASIDISGTTGAFRRIVLTSTDGTKTIVRTIGNITGQTVNLLTTDTIPTSFPLVGGNPDVGLARIETLSRRYTWLLTVRNNSRGDPDISCVVVFNRNYGSAGEHLYAANFGNVTVDVNNDGVADNVGLNQVMIAWQFDPPAGWDPEGTGTDNGNEPDPLLKSGNWIFDARDASWYRIQSIDDSDLTTAPRWAMLTLDKPVRAITVGNGAPDGTNPAGRAILMPGIVEVFPFEVEE